MRYLKSLNENKLISLYSRCLNEFYKDKHIYLFYDIKTELHRRQIFELDRSDIIAGFDNLVLYRRN